MSFVFDARFKRFVFCIGRVALHFFKGKPRIALNVVLILESARNKLYLSARPTHVEHACCIVNSCVVVIASTLARSIVDFCSWNVYCTHLVGRGSR